MAKRKRVNKTQLVRDYLAKHPDAAPKAVAHALRRHSISANYVSGIKTKLKSGSKGARRSKRRASAQAATTESHSILAAAALIKSCGGLREARASLDLAQQVARTLE